MKYLAILFLLMIAGVVPAEAQQRNCGAMDGITAMLAEKYGEVEIRQGLSRKGWLMHLFVSPDGATWTIVGEAPGQGTGCIFDDGTDFQEPPPAEPEGPEA